jgi:riboflavin kinase/FMN adenylyltransferase
VQHIHSLEDISIKNAWVTIGVFDGVHLGHQKLLGRLVTGAHKENSPAVVVTFDPHPAVILGGKAGFKYLTPPEERQQLFAFMGVDITATLQFNRAFANRTAEDFTQTLSTRLGLRHLIIGYDTALGKDRQGDASRLISIGRNLGYKVEVVSPVIKSGEVISSSHIRKTITLGQVSRASEDLGRDYSLEGVVIHGDGRGRELLFPTANILVPGDKLVPAIGIYASWALVEGKRHPAATSIGIRPTFSSDDSEVHVEAYLLDFQGDLYDKKIKLEFVEFLRPEIKFPDVTSLLDQIRKDVGETREILIQ